MSDTERRNESRCEPDGAEPLAEFPSELVSGEPVRQSAPQDAACTSDEPDSSPPLDSDDPVGLVEPPVGPRWRVAGLVAAVAHPTWMNGLVTRSQAGVRGLIGAASHVWSAGLRTSSSLVQTFRARWTHAVFHTRGCAGAPPAFWQDASSQAGHTFSRSSSRVQRVLRPEWVRPAALFLSGVIVGAVLVTAAQRSFTAVMTRAASRDRLDSAVAESLPASTPGHANAEVPDPAAGGGPALRDNDLPGTSAQEDAANPPQSYHGSLVINSRPRGAEVFVNGQPVGRTPLVLDNLQVGSRAVRLKLDGHESWSRAVDVVANQRSSVVALLPPSHP